MLKDSAPRSSVHGKRYRPWLIGAVAFFALLALMFLLIPTNMHGPKSRLRANEAVAVGNLRRLNDLQVAHKIAHPEKGFSCDLPSLADKAKPDALYDPNEFLTQETHG